MQALSKYDSAKPLRASDHFHRWCFDSLKGSYSLNSQLQRDVDQVLLQSGFRRAFPGSSPLFFRSTYGWEVRQRTAQNAREHREYEHHIDQFLATCAQIGAPLSLPIETDFGRVSIGELLEASRRSFDNSQELCWTLVAYCSYLPDEPEWENRFGERCSYESIVTEILSLPLDSGSCGGTHKPFALAYILGSPAAKQLNEGLLRQCEDYLARSSKILESSQLPNGSWGPRWATGDAKASDAQDGLPIRGIDLVRITGHQLEWIGIAPGACRPPIACTCARFAFWQTVSIAPTWARSKKSIVPTLTPPACCSALLVLFESTTVEGKCPNRRQSLPGRLLTISHDVRRIAGRSANPLTGSNGTRSTAWKRY